MSATISEMGECRWVQDEEGNWETGCENVHILLEGTPTENRYQYCPYCGRVIAEDAKEEGE